MNGLFLALVLVGPPKLPPIGGRVLPPEQPAAETTAPATESSPPPAASPKAPAPVTTSARVPPPPPPPAGSPAPSKPTSASPPGTPPHSPEMPPSEGPELQADGPRSPTIATPRKLGATSVTQAIGHPPTAGARPRLRLVSDDEIDRWKTEDTSPAKSSGSTDTQSGGPSVVRTASPLAEDDRPRYRRGPKPPERSAAFLFGYRYFRIEDMLGRPQDWHLASIEVTPVRRYVRVNLVTELGFEGGPAATSGDRADLLLMERLGLGMQYPHVVTPFVEFQGGAGGARVELFGRNDIALFYAIGLDGGAQWSLGGRMFLHAAIGWIRPTFVWPQRTVSYDRVTFKLGFGF